jgi:hypothetical protein
LDKAADEVLIDQMQQGRTDALGVLFDRYGRLVFTVARKILRNDAEAEDLMQEVFIEIYKKAGLYDPGKGSVKISTHSVLGGAASELLRRFFHTDHIPFTTTSGAPFVNITRSFSGFSQAAAENGESRMYAGIHFRTAVEDGIKQGNQIGGFVFTHALQSNHANDDDQ